MTILAIEILLVSLSSYLFTARLFRIRVLSEFVLTWFILFFAQIIAVELSLGVLGKLYLTNILLAHFLVFLIAVMFFRPKQTVDIIKPDISLLFNSRLLLLAFSIFIGFAFVKTFINLINPPISPDSLQYHLAFPAAWIRGGNLDNPSCIFASIPMVSSQSIEASSTSYYPINAQLFFAWLMLPLRNAFLADIGELPFYIIGIMTVFAILKKYGIKNEMAILSGFLWVLIPNIFKQLRTASQIDVICATLFLLMIYTILLLKERFYLKYAVLFGISAGIFLGTKVINIIWFIAAFPFFCYVFYRSCKVFKPGVNKVILMLGSIAFMVFLFGGFAYLRNFVFTGNPLFPVDLKIFGRNVFKGLMDNAAYKAIIASGDKLDLGRILFKEGLGVQFLGLILPAIFAPVIFYRQVRKKINSSGEYLLLFTIPLAMIILYGFFINVYVVRYLFPFLSMGLITAVIFVSLIPLGEKYFYLISFISILASAAELAHRGELITSFALSIILFAIMLLFKKKLIFFYSSRFFNKALMLFLILGVLFLGYFNAKYNKEEFERYPSVLSKKEKWQIDITRGWQKLNELTKDGAKVAYTGRQEFYTFFGSGLKNDVKYISVNEKEVTPYNKFDGLFRKVKEFSAWRENLKKEGIGYLFVARPFFNNRESPDPARFPVEDEWASAHPEDFQLLYSNSMSRIYKILIHHEQK
jgi:hypothetical protein